MSLSSATLSAGDTSSLVSTTHILSARPLAGESCPDQPALPRGNGRHPLVTAASLGGSKTLPLRTLHLSEKVSAGAGVGSTNLCNQRTTHHQEKSFRVSARSQSPTLSRPQQRTSDWGSLEVTFGREDSGSSSGDGVWQGAGGTTKPRRTRQWLVEESKADCDQGSWTRDGEGTGPLPWFSQDVYDDLLGQRAAEHAASRGARISTDDDSWTKLHTAADSLDGSQKRIFWQDDDGSYDLDEARADFQVLQGMLRNLRKGQGTRAPPGGLGVLPPGRPGGVPLPAARLNQPGLRQRSALLSTRESASESLGRPDRRPEGEGADFADLSELFSGGMEEGAPWDGLFPTSLPSAEILELPEGRVSERAHLHAQGKVLEGVSAKPPSPPQHEEERLRLDDSISASQLPAHGVNAPLGESVVSQHGVQRPMGGAYSSVGAVNGHVKTAKELVAGLGSSWGGAQSSAAGVKEPSSVPRVGESTLERVVRRLTEDGAGEHERLAGERPQKRTSSFGAKIAESKERWDAEGYRSRGVEGRDAAEQSERGALQRIGELAVGVSKEGFENEREASGVQEAATASSGEALPEVRTPVETHASRPSPASEVRNGAWKRKSVWRRNTAAEALSASGSASSAAHSLPGGAETGPRRKPQQEPVDESSVAAVVRAVTSLLDSDESVTFRKLEGLLEPWAGKVSQPAWERVLGALESEGDWGGVLAVLAWMVGRHAGTEPEIERALSNAGAEPQGGGGFASLGPGGEQESAALETVVGGEGGETDERFVSRRNLKEGRERGQDGNEGEANRNLFEHEFGDLMSEMGVGRGTGERLKIDADVLDRAVGDRVCSCRICASFRGAGTLFGEKLLPDPASESQEEDGFRSAWHKDLALPEPSSADVGVSAGQPATPPKRRRRRKGSLLSRAVCATAVRALGAAGRLPDALSFLPHLGDSAAGQNLRRTLILHLARDGKAEEALSLLLSARHRSVQLYNVVMDAANKAWLGHERVVTIFDLILADGLTPSVWSYNTVLSALVRENMLEEAFHWMDEMRVRGCKPDAVSYNTLMGARVQFKVARGIFEQMLKEGVVPNLRTFNVLIAALAAIGDYEEVKTWLARMRGMGLEPSQVTYNSIITACLNGGSGLDEALSVVDQMEAAGFSPDVVTYNILIGACSRFGWLEERNDLLADMDSAGIEPNGITRKMIALHRPDDLERGFRKRFEVCPVREQTARIVVAKKGRRRRKALR